MREYSIPRHSRTCVIERNAYRSGENCSAVWPTPRVETGESQAGSSSAEAKTNANFSSATVIMFREKKQPGSYSRDLEDPTTILVDLVHVYSCSTGMYVADTTEIRWKLFI